MFTKNIISIMLRVLAKGPRDQVQSQVKSNERLKKWSLMPPCLTYGIISSRSKANGAIQEKK